LGANVGMYTSDNAITIYGNCLERNYEKTLAIVEEMLLEPRWDVEEFELIKTKTINKIKRSSANPNAVTAEVYSKLIYGENHILGHPSSGTVESVESITMDDIKAFYNANYSPSVSNYHVVGNVEKSRVLKSLKSLNSNWKSKEVKIPVYNLPKTSETAKLYFVDFPDAKQSVINIGYQSLARTDKDYYAATVMNYKLGGSFSGNVNLILREEKGFTYGARTQFIGSKGVGVFKASSSVRTNTTLESVEIFKSEMQKYPSEVSQEDLDFTKNAMIKSNTRKFETLGSLITLLQTRSTYGFPADYIKNEENVVREMTLEELKALAKKYVTPSKMTYLVSGDAATQFEQFNKAGFDEVKIIDKNANEVDPNTEIKK